MSIKNIKNIKTTSSAVAFGLAIACGALQAQTPAHKVEQKVEVSQAWVRATVPGQKGTGGFMRLTAKSATRLVGVSTPAAGIAEVHEMKMDGDVMTMRAVPALELPAGKTVELTPGGYHLMLMDLKAPLALNTTVPMTLRFKDAQGAESTMVLKVPVGIAAPAAHQH